jgi:hypothetical protein
LFRLVWEHDPPNLSLPCSWNHKHTPLHPVIDWDEGGVSQTFCVGWPRTVILPISVSHVARITCVHHQRRVRKDTLWHAITWMNLVDMLNKPVTKRQLLCDFTHRNK